MRYCWMCPKQRFENGFDIYVGDKRISWVYENDRQSRLIDPDQDAAIILDSILGAIPVVDDMTNIAFSTEGPLTEPEEWDPYTVVAAAYMLYGTASDMDQLAKYNPDFVRLREIPSALRIAGDAPSIDEILSRMGELLCVECSMVGAKISINDQDVIDGDLIYVDEDGIGVLVETASPLAKYSISANPEIGNQIIFWDSPSGTWDSEGDSEIEDEDTLKITVSHPQSLIPRVTTLKIAQ